MIIKYIDDESNMIIYLEVSKLYTMYEEKKRKKMKKKIGKLTTINNAIKKEKSKKKNLKLSFVNKCDKVILSTQII